MPDMTDQEQTDQQRIAALQEAVMARDEFIATAAHELRNPMTPIVMLVETLRSAAAADGATPPRIALGLERLERAVQQYVRRVTALLDVTRLTSGAFHLEPEWLDLGLVIEDLATEMQPYATRAGCPLTLLIEPGIQARTDRMAVQQITDNLLSNAVKYGGARPVVVALAREGNDVVLRVVDQGVGISANDQARIFERFERAVTRQHTGGFGVGLWVVGRLVDALGGRLAVESAPNQGSTFTVHLPLTV